MNKINLKKFSDIQNFVMPFIRGRGVYKGRRLSLGRNVTDILHVVLADKIEDTVETTLIDKDAFLSKLPLMRGIAYGNEIIPFNFSVAKFLGYDETIPCYLMNAELGTIIKARRWEDGSIWFHEIDVGSNHQLMLMGVKEKVEKGEELAFQIKGITPEMRYFYLLMTLDKQRIEEWRDLDKLELSKKEREKRIKQFEESFAGRLQKAIEGAGGRLVKFNRRGDRIDVSWMAEGEVFHSTLNQNFSVLDLGFCTEGHDKDHSISSAVILAKQFIDEGLIYKTRE